VVDKMIKMKKILLTIAAILLAPIVIIAELISTLFTPSIELKNPEYIKKQVCPTCKGSGVKEVSENKVECCPTCLSAGTV
jgi:hypothetical protein